MQLTMYFRRFSLVAHAANVRWMTRRASTLTFDTQFLWQQAVDATVELDDVVTDAAIVVELFKGPASASSSISFARKR